MWSRRRRSTPAVQHSASLLTATTHDILSRHAPDGTVRWVSPSVTTVLGFPAGTYVGTFDDVVHRDDLASVRAALITVLAGRPATVLLRAAHADGGWRWLEARATPWPPGGGDVTEIHAVSRDVTDRVQAERAQREAEQRLTLTFEHAPIGMALAGLDGSWIRVNAALCRILGYTREELLARSNDELTHPDDRAASRAYRQKLLDGDIEDYSLDKRYVRGDGTVVWAHITVALLRDDDGAPVHFVTQLQDISDRREMEQNLQNSVLALTETNAALREASAIKDNVLAVVSHELRSPLTSILGFADLLAHRWAELDDERRAEVVGKISAQGRHLQSLVDDLLTVSTLRSGHLTLVPVGFDLLPVVHRAIESAAPAARAAGGEGVHVLGDPQRVEQVLVNLLTNAVKYAAPPFTVEIAAATPAPGLVEIAVADRGDGVPADFVPQLFETFSQASTGNRREARGTGLGLAIVRELVTAMGGTVHHEPNAPGGSRFVVRLPAA